MTNAADSPWPAIARQAWRDLQPAPGRAGMAWRVALLCSLVAATAMLLKIPESAISCYLVIFLMKPDAVETSVTAVGLILLATVVVVVMIPIVDATIDDPALRLAVMFAASYVFLFLSSATPLGEQAAIVGLIIAFIMTLVTDVPVGQIADQGLLMAWKMAVMPMVLMIGFNLALGIPAQTHIRNKVAERLEAAARWIDTRDNADALAELLGEGNDTALKKMQLVEALHLVPTNRSAWLNGAVETSYRILLAASAMPEHLAGDRREALSAALRRAAADVEAGRVPGGPERPAVEGDAAEADAWSALEEIAAPDGGGTPRPRKLPFLAPDAFTNPDHQRFALKTSIAAILCYLIYTGIHWGGIHTAMITCYVAALGSTGETVRKLALRIAGCLIGAGIGVLSLLFVMPWLTSVGGLMVLVFAGVLPAAWVSSGSERISYAGVQIALAFLLTILNGFGPSFEMSQASDRIVGILLGNVVVYLIFSQIWPKSAMETVRSRVASALHTVAALIAQPAEARSARVAGTADAQARLAEAAEILDTVAFEPRRLQPPRAEVTRIAEIVAEARACVPRLVLTARDTDGTPGRLRALADRLARAGGVPEARPDVAETSNAPGSGGGPGAGLDRLEQIAKV